MKSISGSKGVITRIAISFVLAIGLLCSGAASANLFIKFYGVEGESTDKAHKGWSDITSVQWGVSISGSVRPVLSVSDLTWSQQMDKSFPPLFTAIAGGDAFRDATVDFTTTFGEGVQKTYFQMLFDDVQLTSLNLSGGSDNANVDGAFSYGRIRMTYTEYDASGKSMGTTKADYDVKGTKSAAALLTVFELGMSGPSIIPIPEPEAYALLLAGLGLLGFAARRRKQKTA